MAILFVIHSILLYLLDPHAISLKMLPETHRTILTLKVLIMTATDDTFCDIFANFKLTLKVLFMTAADDKFCDIFANFKRNITP